MKLIIQKIRDFLLRKKRKNKQLLFFEKIGDRNTSREEMLNNLIKALEKNGFKIYIGNQSDKKFRSKFSRELDLYSRK